MGEPSRIPIPLIYSGRVRNALRLAELSHRGMTRKSGDHPYLLHLVAVGQLLAASSVDDDLLCAGYLHDVVEDTEVTLMEIEDEFGSRVAALVGAVTNPQGGAKEERSRLVREAMHEAPIEVCVLKGADLITNMTDLVLDQREHGLEHFSELFGERAVGKIEHYLELAEILRERLADDGGYPLLVDYLRERSQQLGRMLKDFQNIGPLHETPEEATR
jgi:(p)ppGpp synthase/HD superfamily hydrolase